MKKIDNLKEYEISSDIEFLSEMILKQIKKQLNLKFNKWVL